ncbi:MAG: ATP-binding protein [Candidatus Magasanikbacteria bacterium]|nr:ATP-binding protein [Candidatus Magasanikbacteria bacterium]
MKIEIKHRYLEKFIISDLKEKMVFIGGPRQVGKTTLSRVISEHYPDGATAYLNWDNKAHRRNILADNFAEDARLVIFDEIHKYHRWKNHLKGIFDVHRDRFHFLVTGSARLDVYRRGGDSLLGRYHYYRLHPFSVAELIGLPPPRRFSRTISPTEHSDSALAFQQLLRWGGFPEPLLRQYTKAALQRWQQERTELLIKDDIRDLESVRDLSALQILSDLLPAKVGSPLSLNALRGDLEVAHKTIAHWIDIFERMYFHFRIYPYTNKMARMLHKEPKLYLWDWSMVNKESARLENLVASHLLKFVHFWHDTAGYRTDLRYLRDFQGREVDFLVTLNNQPWFAVEVKTNDEEISPHLRYFSERLRIPHLYQVVSQSRVDFNKRSVRVISADKFLAALV